MKKKMLIGAISVLSAGLVALGGYTLWHYRLPKFHDVTMELGETLPDIKTFLTEDAREHKAMLVTEKGSIDLSRTGTQKLTFSHGSKEETVTLTIQDTTAPVLTLQDVVADIGTEVKVEDFVVSAEDWAPVTLKLSQPLKEPEGYGDVTVQIIATDASGNAATGQCILSYNWMHNNITMELGDTLSKGDILINPEKDGSLLDQAALDALTTAPVGNYPISATTTDGKVGVCQVTVVDTVAPDLKVRDVTIYEGDQVSKEAFIEAATDLSGEVTTGFVTQPDTSKSGSFTVTVEAADINGNLATANATLTVRKDTTPPAFSGLKNLSTDKGKTPNYTSGVSAKDERDGKVDFEYDASQVDISKPGTYYVTYTARDRSGNKATEKRKLTVLADTKPPKFSGLSQITTEKNKKPDYSAGVAANDNWDGQISFTYDDSKVDLTKAGTYYVTYTAVDLSGNRANSRRKVVVNHDKADTKALVQSVAAGLSSDPEAIRDYVRSSIKYSSSWGEDDPVWYGFKNKKGNCYVHALCLQELLEEKGYATKLIWVTDKSHYWLLINLGGSWKHIDATPGTRHTKYSLMNDQQRLETLSGRTWDATQWPACE